VRALPFGDSVIYGHWFGRVEEVLDNVTVVFEDGRNCRVQHAKPSCLVPSSESSMDDTKVPYYPGQRIWIGASGIFKNEKVVAGLLERELKGRDSRRC